MTALDSITMEEPSGVYSLLAKVLDVADSGSVITRDHAVGILVKLGARKQYADQCVPLLVEQLLTCPNNQFPMYAEMSLALVNDKSKAALQDVMTRRLDGLEKESQKKRVAKVLAHLTKKPA